MACFEVNISKPGEAPTEREIYENVLKQRSIENKRLMATKAKKRVHKPNPNLHVCVRVRPADNSVITCQENAIVVHEPKVALDTTPYNEGTGEGASTTRHYVEDHTFDGYSRVFAHSDSTGVIFESEVAPMVQRVVAGNRAAVFCFGHSGSGKTHTILGNDDEFGLYSFAAASFCEILEQENGLALYTSCYEVYNNNIFDLSSGKRVAAREDENKNTIIVGLSETRVDSLDCALDALRIGRESRAVGSSNVHDKSSRSHAVFMLTIKKAAEGSDEPAIHGSFAFIDLAGNDPEGPFVTDKALRQEFAAINKSLLALKECIRALDEKSKHVPYRQSKLTQVLRSYFGPKALTTMVATISPSQEHLANTLGTVRWADRANKLRGRGADTASKRKPRPDWRATVTHDEKPQAT